MAFLSKNLSAPSGEVNADEENEIFQTNCSCLSSHYWQYKSIHDIFNLSKPDLLKPNTPHDFAFFRHLATVHSKMLSRVVAGVQSSE